MATIHNGSVYYIHTDHLGTPRSITDNGDTEVWRWDSDPFGMAATNEDPDGDGMNFIYNLRFAGQYFDTESGLHYNYFRDYEPGTGRYIQSDPIGLSGGINTYLYVNNNPIRYVDFYGLCPCGNPADVVKSAVDSVGSDEWSYFKEKGRFEEETNKCNLFVEDKLTENGFNIPDMNGYFSYNGPTAGQWGDPDVNIPGYPVVSTPMPGDIIAIPHDYSDATGHVGIVTGVNSTASQSSISDRVENNDWGHRPGQSPVYRRCQCPGPVDPMARVNNIDVYP